jgi:hypothetical protein
VTSAFVSVRIRSESIPSCTVASSRVDGRQIPHARALLSLPSPRAPQCRAFPALLRSRDSAEPAKLMTSSTGEGGGRAEAAKSAPPLPHSCLELCHHCSSCSIREEGRPPSELLAPWGWLLEGGGGKGGSIGAKHRRAMEHLCLHLQVVELPSTAGEERFAVSGWRRASSGKPSFEQQREGV